MRHVIFDKTEKKIIVVNRVVVQEIELNFRANILGVDTDDDLQELIKRVGGIAKFKKFAQAKVLENDQKSRAFNDK